MLTRVDLINFMSYENESITMGSDTAIAITGPNGAGKSTIVEAIVFGYWGVGRVPVADMVRKGAVDGMMVSLHHFDPKTKDTILVERGRTMNGKGFAKVKINGDIHCEGNDTKAWIETFLGMNKETFLLTSYYGSAGGALEDSLMDTTSAERWETFQKIGRVTVYQKAEKRAKEWQSELARDRIALNSRIQMKRETTIEDLSDIENAILRGVDRVQLLKDRLGEWKEMAKRDAEVRETLAKEEERLSNWEAALDDLRRTQKSKLEKRKVAEKAEAEAVKAMEATQARLDTAEKRVLSDKDRKEFEGYQRTTVESLAKSKSMIALYQSGVAVDHAEDHTCPLCKNEVSATIIADWNSEIDRLTEYVKKLDRNLVLYKKTLDDSRISQQTASTARENLQRQKAEVDKQKDIRIEMDRDILELEEWIEKCEEKVTAKKKEIAGLKKTIPDEELDIDGCAKELGNEERNLKTLKEDLSQERENQKELSKLKKELGDLDAQLESAKLLVTGFGKYGIPQELITSLITEVARLATECYQNFDAGDISIEITEGEKPGIGFALTDRKGKRLYEALSAGEKVMYYVSMRTAVSQVMSGVGEVNIDWLILDEIMGNLTQENRDNMMRLTSNVLRKMFPKLLMVSHVEVRDVFDRTITVRADEGISHVA